MKHLSLSITNLKLSSQGLGRRSYRCERLAGGCDGSLDVFFGVSCAEEGGFELRCWQVDSTLQHRPEEAAESFCIALRGRSPIGDRTGR